jgi:hypothetical protein
MVKLFHQKKRLQSEQDYLWVVYPRTNDKAGKLHVEWVWEMEWNGSEWKWNGKGTRMIQILIWG